jgi:MFS family permease
MNKLKENIYLQGNIRVLAIQTLVSQIGFGMFYVIWQPFILSTGASITELGIIQSIINIVTVIGLIFWGMLSDRIGRKPVIIASYVVRILAMLMLLVSSNPLFLLIFAFLIGLSCNFMSGNPARSALISESITENQRATAFGTIMTMSQITNAIAASAGGYIAIQGGYNIIFYISIIGDIIGILLISSRIKETHQKTIKRTQISSIIRLKTAIIPEKGIYALYLIAIVIGFGYNIGFSIFYGTLVDNFGFTELQLGFISSSFSLVSGLSAIPAGYISDRYGKKLVLFSGWFCGVISITGFMLSKRLELFILFQVISAFDFSLFYYAWLALISEVAPSDMLSTVMGKLDSFTRLFGIPAPWLAGLLYTNYGYKAPFAVHLIFLIIYGMLLILMKDKL